VTTAPALPDTRRDEAPFDPPVERGLIVLPDGTELPFAYGGPVVVLDPPAELQPSRVAAVESPRDRFVRGVAAVRRFLAGGAAWTLDRIRPAALRFEDSRRRAAYRGRHHVQRRWFGRARSTAEVTGAYHRNYRAGVDLTEVDLPVPIYWTGWLYRFVEVLRAEDEALHPSVGHRFTCS
jgi:hypothetical protein